MGTIAGASLGPLALVLVAMVVLMVVAVVVVVLDGIGKATSRSRPSHWVLAGLVELSA